MNEFQYLQFSEDQAQLCVRPYYKKNVAHNKLHYKVICLFVEKCNFRKGKKREERLVKLKKNCSEFS